MIYNFQRPNLPYDYESLQNCNEFQNITADGRAISPLLLETTVNYVIDSLRILDDALDGAVVGAIPGAANITNRNKFLSTDGENLSWVFVTQSNISDNSFPGTKLFAQSITNRELAPACVLTSNYGPKSITTSALGDLVVTENQIADRSIPRSKIALKTITNEEIALKTITNEEMDDNNVQTRNVLDRNITRSKIALKAISNDEMDDNNVQTRNIQDKNVPISKINSESSVSGYVMTSDGAGGAIWQSSKVLQVVSVTTNANTITNQIFPLQTLPKNTDGVEMLTCSITPKSASSTLYIRWSGQFGYGGSVQIYFGAGLFQDDNVNALNAQYSGVFGTGLPNSFLWMSSLEHKLTSGTTNPTTFKIRAGSHIGATCRLNSYNSTNGTGGGVTFAKLEIWEIAS